MDEDWSEGGSEYVSGNIYVRACYPRGMKAGQVVLGHQHNFDHTTYVKRGVIEVSLLDCKEVNSEGNPINATVAWSKIINAEDEVNWVQIVKGRFHMLRSLVDGSVYHCIYAHQLPQALTVGVAGQRPHEPLTKVDENGVVWYRENSKIIDTSRWQESYR